MKRYSSLASHARPSLALPRRTFALPRRKLSAAAPPASARVTRRDLLYLLLGAASSAVVASFTLEPLLRSESAPSTSSPQPSQASFEACLAELRSHLPPDCLSHDLEDLRAHGIGQWTELPAKSLPGLVAYPRHTDDVVAIVKAANKHGIPIVPFGAGTSIEGQINAPEPVEGGSERGGEPQPGYAISVSLGAHMNELVALHENDLTVTVQPGLGYETLNAHLEHEGIPLFFPVDPGPGATIGGMVGTGCSGTNAVRYGTMREAVRSLKVVLPSGEIITTRSRAAKSSAGPDLTKIFVGSEGTLGIVVEATLKLAPVVPSTVGVATFSNVQAAANVVAQMLKQDVTVQCLELLDDSLLRAVNAASKRDQNGLRHFDEKPTLFIKMQGDKAALANTHAKVANIVRTHGGDELVMAQDASESEMLWRARKVALNSAFAMAPECKFHSTDVCVPISQLPVLISELKADLAKQAFAYSGIVGHAGDGNLHTIILYENEAQDKAAMEFADRMARRAQQLGGTCTGEHGVGVAKKHLLYDELGGSVDLLRDIKRVVDPKGIMNPGTLIPPPR